MDGAAATVEIPTKLTFDEVYPELERIVSSRRAAWTYVSLMEWQDVAQELFIRLYRKYPQYDPTKGPLEHWANTLISNAFKNLRRDLYLRTAPPCIGGGKANGKHCAYNGGGESCSYTPSKIQCAECPLYAKWQREREAQHHAKSQVSLENHTQEVSNVQCDFVDIEGVRDWVYKTMLKELSRWEGRVFRLVIIKALPPAKVAEMLAAEVARRKRPPAPHEQYSYSAVLVYARQFRGCMRVLLYREGYISEANINPKKSNRR